MKNQWTNDNDTAFFFLLLLLIRLLVFTRGISEWEKDKNDAAKEDTEKKNIFYGHSSSIWHRVQTYNTHSGISVVHTNKYISWYAQCTNIQCAHVHCLWNVWFIVNWNSNKFRIKWKTLFVHFSHIFVLFSTFHL